MTDYDECNTEFCPECDNTVNISQTGVCFECGLNIFEYQFKDRVLDNCGKQSKSSPIYESTVKRGPHKSDKD